MKSTLLHKSFTLVVSNGSEYELTLCEMLDVLRHRFTLLCMFMVFIFLGGIDLYENLKQLTVLVRYSFILLLVIVTLVMYYFILLIHVRRALIKKQNPRVFSILPMIIAIQGTTTLELLFATFVLNDPPTFEFLILISCFNIVIGEAITTIFINFTLPLMLKEIRSFSRKPTDSADTNRAEPKHIYKFGGQSFDPGLIRCAKSDDAYVEINSVIGNYHVRGKISDLANDLDELGLSPHRSYWVATEYIMKIEMENPNQWHLILDDLTQIPVAKSKQALVEQVVSRA